MKTVSVRLTEKDIQKLEKIAETNVYSSNSDAARMLIRQAFEKYSGSNVCEVSV